MIKAMIDLLKMTKDSDSEIVRIAKGKYMTPTNLKGFKRWLMLRK